MTFWVVYNEGYWLHRTYGKHTKLAGSTIIKLVQDRYFTTHATSICCVSVKSKRMKRVGRVSDLKWSLNTFFVKISLTLETCKIASAVHCTLACTAMEFVRVFIVAPKKRDYRKLTDTIVVAVKQSDTFVITASCAGEMRRNIKWLKHLVRLHSFEHLQFVTCTRT